MKLRPQAADGHGSTAGSAGSFFRQDVAVALIIAWVARFIFMLAMPSHARSFDAIAWETVADTLNAGGNPYQTTSFLSWPPFWFQMLFVISKISSFLSLPFFRVLQLSLIIIESIVIVLLAKLIHQITPQARVRALLIFGIALNPAAILLICQHCNFDVMVVLWVLLFLLNLLRFNQTKDPADCLCACLFLGLGILTKTVPLVLVPLLAGGFRTVAGPIKLMGLALLFGPAALGMSVIYVIAPAGVTTHVLGYHSIGDFFGVSGLLHLAGLDPLAALYNLFFYLLLLTLMLRASLWFWQARSMGDRETVLLTALLLVLIPALGPGYGPHYLYWFLPLLVASYAFFEGKWRRVLIAFGVVAAITYLVEYALVGSDGMYLLKILASNKETLRQAVSLLPVVQKCESPTGLTLIRLPLFIAYLALLKVGTDILLEQIKNRQKQMDG